MFDVRFRTRAVALLMLIGWTGHAQEAGPVEPTSKPATGSPASSPPDPSDSEAPSAPPGFSLEPRLFGYIQVHYRYALDTGEDELVDYDDFRVQRVRLGVEGDVFPWLSYDIEVDPRAPDVSSVLRDAFLSFKVIPRHSIRVGQQKTQFGYENRESSRRLFAVNRTELSDNLSRGGDTLRDIGIGLLGNIKLGGGFRLEDAITLVNGAGMNAQDDDTEGKDVWGRIGLRYKQDDVVIARLGVSGAAGDYVDEGDDPDDPMDDFRVDFRRYGVDLEVDQTWFFLSAELVLGRDEIPALGESDDPSGYYVNLVGKTAWQVGPIARYDTLGDEFQRWTFGAYYGAADARFRVMFNYELRHLKDDARGDDKLYLWTQLTY